MRLLCTLGLSAAALLYALLAQAAPEGELFGIEYRLKTRLTSGVSVRMEERDSTLVAKLSNQNLLCAPNECATVEQAQRLFSAPGTYSGVNSDDGNWNYERYDLVAASTRLAPELTLSRGPLRAVVSGLGYYDPVNVNFDEFHGDTRFQPQNTPRPKAYEKSVARGFELRQAYVQGKFDLGERGITVSYGRQVVPWGEGLLVVLNTTNALNPLDGRAAGTSGFALSELLFPIAMGVVQFPLFDSFNVELVVPTEWKPVQLAPPGSFFSISDVAGRTGAGETDLTLSQGAANEDPERRHVADPNGAGFVSSSKRSIRVLPEEFGHANAGGQYGGRLSWLLETEANTVEVGGYYLHYHSQFPYFSAFAAQESCARDSANVTEAAVDCRGFKPSSGSNPQGLEPIPIDTAVAFLDYPRNIDLFGVSFNSGLYGWGVSGEYVYRPNLPVQIHTTDVIYAALQPALPRQDIILTPAAPGRPAGQIPGSRNALPDFISQYRGMEVQPGQRVDGYERLEVHQVSLSGLSVFPQNPVGADQVTVLIEVGGMYISDLPPENVLPFLGSGESTHPTPGRDGSGTADGMGDARRSNPHFLDDGLTTAFSAGYRVLLRLQYINLLPNITLEPQLLLFHDLLGYSPAPLENFKQGRIAGSLGATAKIGDLTEVGASYNLRAGGERQNFETDRDFLSAFVSFYF